MINHLSKVTNWTGGGLNASGNPAKNIPPNCGLLMKLDGTKWVQAYPKKLGTFDCSSKYVVSQHRVGDRHHAERPGLRHPVRHLLDPQAAGVSAQNVSPPAA